MDGCASPLDAILEIAQLVAFLKKWEVMARLEWTPEANEVVWAGTGSWTPVGGMEAATPPTGAIPRLGALSPLYYSHFHWPRLPGSLSLPRYHLTLHQICVSFLLLL